MNEAILTSRQKYILNLISSADGLLREQIQREANKIYKLSKPTLLRDLQTLLKNRLIKTQGNAKNTTYIPFIQNPLLRYFDLDFYFQQDPDKRLGAQKGFDLKIFSQLRNLIIPYELENLKKISRSFKEQSALLSSDILKRELERFVVELSWKSSKIEGNTYSLLETEALIKEHKVAKGKTREETIMILNHKSAFEDILKHKNEFKILSL